MFTLPGIPFIYYGDEIGMKFVDLPNKDGGFQRVGSRTPMQWNHSVNDGFSKAKELYLPVNTASDITVEDNLKNPQSLYYFVQKLINLRKSLPALQTEDMEINEKNRVLTISRDNVTMIINLSEKPVSFKAKELLISTENEKDKVNPYNGVIFIK